MRQHSYLWLAGIFLVIAVLLGVMTGRSTLGHLARMLLGY